MFVYIIITHTKALQAEISEMNSTYSAYNRHCAALIKSKFLEFILKYLIKLKLIKEFESMLLHFIRVGFPYPMALC